MTMDQMMWDRVFAYCKQHGMDVREKDDSVFMKLLYYCLFMFWWNPTFMTHYTTTIGRTVYMPRRMFRTRSGWAVLAHEQVHAHDHEHKGGVLWGMRYLMPQLAAVLGLLGLLGLAWWPLFFLFLLLALAFPWPSPWRVEAEVRAYALSLAIDTWIHEASPYDSNRPSDMCAFYVDALIGSSYWWPAGLWNREAVRMRLMTELRLRATQVLVVAASAGVGNTIKPTLMAYAASRSGA